MYTKNKIKRSTSDVVFDTFSYTVLTVLLLILIYPLYFVVIASFSDPNAIYNGEVIFKISGFTLTGYKKVFENSQIWIGYRNSLFYLVAGTLINLIFTIPSAYALSRKDMAGRNVIMGLFVFTMFFGGGLIPTFLLVKSLNLYNSVWVLLILGAVNVFNLIVAKTFFQNTIPDELLDAAIIDGCSDFHFFGSIVMPLSKAIIAVMVLYYGVGHWNSYFTAQIYIENKKLYPLQLVLRGILIQNQVSSENVSALDNYMEQQKVADLIKYGAIIISSVPMLILYPFVQKYFVQGVMIGALKG